MHLESYPDRLVTLVSEMHKQLGQLRSAPPQPVFSIPPIGRHTNSVIFPGWLFRDREVLHDALFDGIAYIDRHRFSLPVAEVSQTYIDLVSEAFADHRARVVGDPLIASILAAGAYGGALPDADSTVRSALQSALAAMAAR